MKLFNTRQQIRATATGYFNATINNIKSAISNPDGVQFVIYSAHDTTIMNFLVALNLTNVECVYEAFTKNITKNTPTCVVVYPSYTSQIIFEVLNYKNGTNNFKIRYNG